MLNLTEEQKQTLIEGVKIESVSKSPYGGQTVGMPVRTIRLSHPDCDFVVEVGEYRSQLENANLGLDIFKYYLSKI